MRGVLVGIGVVLLLVAGAFMFTRTESERTNPMTTNDQERVFSGAERPPNIPDDWHGEPLPDGVGWRWFNPDNRGDSVRLFRGDPDSPDSSVRNPYVIVTRNGEVIGRDGNPTGEILND